MSTLARKYKSAELVDMIRAKYSGSAYCVLEQVASGTGSRADSWIDAAVFSLWPSNGIWRSACEVKVSRADFLHELARPAKNEWARKHFDFFWYVVAPGVAKDDEVPEGCGLMVVRGGGLSIAKQAPRRADVITDAGIVASFARSLDKEREQFVRRAVADAKANDPEIAKARMWQAAAEKYLKLHDDHSYHHTTAEAAYEALVQTQSDKGVKADTEHTMKVLERFKGEVLQFLLAIAPLAANVITARDEAADFVVRTYGGTDEKSLDALRKLLKQRDQWRRGEVRTTIGAIEELAILAASPVSA